MCVVSVQPHRSASVGAREDVTIKFEGSLDLLTGDALREAALVAVRDHAGSGIHIDLTLCDFIDSSGILSLMRIREAALAANMTVRVTATHASVLRAMDLIGLRTVLDVRPASGSAAG